MAGKCNSARCSLGATRPAETVALGRADGFIRPIETPRRGFSLRLVAAGPKLSCFLDGRLDNFEVRAAE